MVGPKLPGVFNMNLYKFYTKQYIAYYKGNHGDAYDTKYWERYL